MKELVKIQMKFGANPSGESARRNQAATGTISGRMAEAMKNPQAAAAFQAEMQKITHETSGSSEIVVLAVINSPSVSIENFVATHSIAKIPGVGFSVEAPYVQSRGGGDIGSSHDETFVFAGNWVAPPPLFVKEGEGEKITVKGQLKTGAATLSVQNIYLRIQANPQIAQTVMGLIDWDTLRQLLGGN